MRILTILLLLGLSFSCASKKKGEPLFPHGVYNQEVHVDREEKDYTFPAVTEWKKDEFSTVALGPMYVTLLSCEENFKTGEKKVYVNTNLIPITEEKTARYCGFLKMIFELDRSICEGKKCHTSIYMQDIDFELNDKMEVKTIRMERGTTKVKVKVTGYEKAR